MEGAGFAVLAALAVTPCAGPGVAGAVPWGPHEGLAAPGDPPPRAAVAAEPPPPLAPEDRLPVPAGVPPLPPPDPPDVSPPVSTAEPTCTIACLNGGTASAMLATKATPASTPTGRSQPMPGRRPCRAAAARCRAGEAWAAGFGSSRKRGRGRELSLGRDCGQAQ